MWWQEHWLELATLVSVVAAAVRMEMTLRHLVDWRRDFSEADAEWKEGHGERLARVEADYVHVLNKCPAIREARLRGEDH